MNNTTESFPSWIRQIPGELYQLDEKPLLGFPSPFPWPAFSSNLAQSLQINSLSFAPGDLQWRTEPELFSGLGDRLKTLSLAVSPFTGGVWWVMPEQGISRLMHALLSTNTHVFSENIDEGFFKAFYQFLAAEAINSIEKIDFDKKLAPTVLKEVYLPAEACLCLDVSIAIDNEVIYGRLLLSQAFRKSWMQHYTQEQKKLALSSPIADSLDVVIHIEAGKINLKPSEWKQIVPGDFVILDSCSLDADEDKGRVMLVINGTPFFRAKIKQGSLKILEHPLYHEVDTAMGTPPKKNEDEEFDDSDFDLDDETTSHDQTTEHDVHTTNHDETTHHDDASDLSNDLDFSDASLSDTENEKTPVQSSPKPKSAAPSRAIAAAGSTTPLSVDEIPLTIVIEIGRIQMSVKKLMELQPGNMLDLNIHPESGVDMVVNGKRIARGELLKIGDSLGIRISELS